MYRRAQKKNQPRHRVDSGGKPRQEIAVGRGNHVVEQTRYSVDGGATFQAVPDSPIIKKRSITWWSTTSQDSTPGFTEHLRKLPADCFGREKVVLRLQVADKVTDIDPKATSSNYLTALGIEKGTLTPSVAAGNSQARIGTITVRYN